ncbi:UNVERIFIED_CONTAM: Mitogen-activated protein kinase kinase kinase kinase 4 [Siphonaria sp. JEL0065]|nr:Mitogen-activated protein kinase kinase kinase kinase 4 [Siphonaria sp. JEL0065]
MSISSSVQQYGKKFPILLRTPSPKGQVELIETVGKGNYGYVYKGRLINSNEISAIKVVFLKEDELKETLLEMEILKACNHPNITKYMAIKKPLTEDQIASIIYESVVGLEYLHNQVALIHRDIKAGNLLLTEQGELKLADFGVSAKLKSPQGTARTFIGTPYWMAPEVISCDPESASSQSAHYDCKADIWSIGITAIEIADKNPPLSDIHPMRALHLIPSSNLGLAKPKNWTKVFVDFISCCLVKDPVKRPSAKEILQHPFMQKAAGLPRQKLMEDLVKKAKLARERKKAGIEVADDEEEEQEKKQAIPVQVLAETQKRAKIAQETAKRQAEDLRKQQIAPAPGVPLPDAARQQLVVAAPAPNEVIKPSMLGADFPGFIEEGSVSNRVLTPTLLGGVFKDILGADILDDKFVLIGTERGLFFNEISTPRIEPIPLIRNIRFKQVQVVSEYNVLIALSGKHNHVRQYKLSSIRKLIYYLLGTPPAQLARTNLDTAPNSFGPGGILSAPEKEADDDEYTVLQDKDVIEDETTLIAKWTNDYFKILATKDSSSFLVQKTEASVYLGVLFQKDVILFEWAKDPYLRFMKLKAFWLPEAPKFMNLITDGLTVREVYMAYSTEANLVQVTDSKVIEVEVHREFVRSAQATGGGPRSRWQSFNQIPFSDAKRNELKSMSRPNSTVNRKLVAVTGSGGNITSTVVDRYFLATFHRLTRVVDISSQPMMGSGVGGWKDGVTWLEAPNQIVMRPVDQVIAVGKQTIEVADWKSAQILQTFKVDSAASVRVLSDSPGSFLAIIDRGRKGAVLYHMKEKSKPVDLAAQQQQVEADLARVNISQQQQGGQRTPPGVAPRSTSSHTLNQLPQQQQQQSRVGSDVSAAQFAAHQRQQQLQQQQQRPHSQSFSGPPPREYSGPPPREYSSPPPQHFSPPQQYQPGAVAPPPGQYYQPNDPRYAQQQQQYYAQQQQYQQYYAQQQAQPGYQPQYDPRYGAPPPQQGHYVDPRYNYQYYGQQGAPPPGAGGPPPENPDSRRGSGTNR